MTKLEMVNAIVEVRVRKFGCDAYRMKKALGFMSTREITIIYNKEVNN